MAFFDWVRRRGVQAPVRFAVMATIAMLVGGVLAGLAAHALGVADGWQPAIRTAAHALVAGLLLWAVRTWPEAAVGLPRGRRGINALWLPLLFALTPWTNAGLRLPAGFSWPALITEEVGTGLAEEMLCRGFLLALFLRAWRRTNGGVRRAVWVQGVVFGVAHVVVGDPFVVLTALVLGVLFGAAAVRLGSLWPLVPIHAIGNLGYQLLPEDGGGGTGAVVVAGLAIMITLASSAYLLRDSVLPVRWIGASTHARGSAVTEREALPRLVALLQLAHSGERAAAYAYAGHWRSVRQPVDREAIRKIELDEWDHRGRVFAMLAALGERPARRRELRMAIIGRTVAALCFVSGRFIPMYGAGMIERRNVHEYVDAAAFATSAGHPELVDELLDMAQVEWDHEQYFRSQVEGRWQLRLLPLWPPLGLRAALRTAQPS